MEATANSSILRRSSKEMTASTKPRRAAVAFQRGQEGKRRIGMSKPPEKKLALVTGSSSGIGATIAVRLAAEGPQSSSAVGSSGASSRRSKIQALQFASFLSASSAPASGRCKLVNQRIRTECYWRFTDAAVRVAIKRTTFRFRKKLRVVRLTDGRHFDPRVDKPSISDHLFFSKSVRGHAATSENLLISHIF